MAPHSFCYIVRPDTQRKAKSGQIQVVRGANVPLIAVDELPDWIEIYGVPRELPSEQTIGLQSLGLMSKNSEPYLVQLHQRVFAARREQYQGDDSKGHSATVSTNAPPASPTGQQATTKQAPVANTATAPSLVRQATQIMPNPVHQTPAGQTPQALQASVPSQASVAQASPPTPTVPTGLLTSRHAPKPPTSTPAPPPVASQTTATPFPLPPPSGTPSSAQAPVPPAIPSQPTGHSQPTIPVTTTSALIINSSQHLAPTPQVPITQPAVTTTSAAVPAATTQPAAATPDQPQPQPPREPCIHYLKWGKCKFEPQCKHSHDITPAALASVGLSTETFPAWILKKLSRQNQSQSRHQQHQQHQQQHQQHQQQLLSSPSNLSNPYHRSIPPPSQSSSYSSSSSEDSRDQASTTSSDDTLPRVVVNRRGRAGGRAGGGGAAKRMQHKQEKLLAEMRLQLENLTLKQKERELKIALMRQQQLGLSSTGGGNGGRGYTINSIGGIGVAGSSRKRLRLPKRGSNTPLDRERKKLRGEVSGKGEESNKGKGVEGGKEEVAVVSSGKEGVVVAKLVDI